MSLKNLLNNRTNKASNEKRENDIFDINNEPMSIPLVRHRIISAAMITSRRARVKYNPNSVAGEVYGKLTIICHDHDEYRETNHGRQVHHIVKCRCECGNTILAHYDSLRGGNTRSCGCLHIEKTIELVKSRATYDPEAVKGEVYGRLTVIGHDHDEVEVQGKRRNGSIKKNTRHYVKVECECGAEFVAGYKELRSGNIQSCGCLHRDMLIARNTTHGLFKDPLANILYRNVYTQMIRRCYSKKSNSYKHYGGRGIYICKEWYTPGVPGNPGFVAFYHWAITHGYKHEPDTSNVNIWSIDRIDVDGPYSPDNCRWADRQTQANNKTNNITLIDITGDEIPRGEFSAKYGLDNKDTIGKYNSGWSNDALLYDAMHKNLGLHKTTYRGQPTRYLDRDGFIVLIPTIETQTEMYNRRNINGKTIH